MSLTYDEALQKLHEWTEGASLRKHARAVEIVMRRAAERYGHGATDEPTWAIAGLVHDADYERWPDEHPQRVLAWLNERGETAIAHAVAAHSTRWGVPCESTLDKALLASDELTGFVMACCLVRPDGIHSLKPASVKKKFKDRAFAAKVEREEVQTGIALLGANFDEHVQLIIDALTPHAEGLGLQGANAS